MERYGTTGLDFPLNREQALSVAITCEVAFGLLSRSSSRLSRRETALQPTAPRRLRSRAAYNIAVHGKGRKAAGRQVT